MISGSPADLVQVSECIVVHPRKNDQSSMVGSV
jgi:hypothetical protein